MIEVSPYLIKSSYIVRSDDDGNKLKLTSYFQSNFKIITREIINFVYTSEKQFNLRMTIIF